MDDARMKRAFLACCALTAVGMAALWIAIRPASDVERMEALEAQRDPTDEALRAVMMAELPHTVATLRAVSVELDNLSRPQRRRIILAGGR